MLSSDIYSQESIKNLNELGTLIYDSVLRFNNTRAAEVLEYIYNSMPSGLCLVLEIHGKRILLADWHLWNMFRTVRIMYTFISILFFTNTISFLFMFFLFTNLFSLITTIKINTNHILPKFTGVG